MEGGTKFTNITSIAGVTILSSIALKGLKGEKVQIWI